jgi:dTDP-4-amino-4,6-dideoxygalactose transaminase
MSQPQKNLRSRWPLYEEDEIAAVANVLRSGRVNSLHHGEHCKAFEAAFAHLCCMPFAISLANGTVALELALRALGVGPGDEVIVPARSFFASASCIVAVGATPIFADIDPISQGLEQQSVRQMLSSRTRAVLCVHLGGWPCDVQQLKSICDEKGLFLIEDCAQAHGATINGQPVGSFGDASAFSFCTDKIISTGGEGGMLLLRDEGAYERAWSFKDHGKCRSMVEAGSGGSHFRWLHTGFGTNFRMTEMQAAIGLCQLAKLPRWLDARKRNAAAVREALRGISGALVDDPPASISPAYYRFYARIDTRVIGEPGARDAIAAAISSRGPVCGSGSCPEIYREKAFDGTEFAPKRQLSNAHALGECSLVFQCDHTLGADESAEIGSIAADVIFGWAGKRVAA